VSSKNLIWFDTKLLRRQRLLSDARRNVRLYSRIKDRKSPIKGSRPSVPHGTNFYLNLVHWSRGLCLSVILLLLTKFCVNRTISRWDIAKKLFSLWLPPAILNLQNLYTLSCYVLGTKICICKWWYHWTMIHMFTRRMPWSGKLPILNLLAGQKSGFSPHRGDSLHRFMSNLAWPMGTWVRSLCKILPQSVQGWESGPQNTKNFHFLVKSRPTGTNPLTDY